MRALFYARLFAWAGVVKKIMHGGLCVCPNSAESVVY